jgi:hypothetical protein
MKYKIIVAFLMATVYSYAQNDLVRYRPCSSGCGPNDYGAITIFATQDIVSDYGVRKANGTRFHQAIDYTVYGVEDNGYAIVAISEGNVSNINGGDSYKGITVGNYRYTHIFESLVPTYGNFISSGKFILKQVVKVNETDPTKIPWAIIDLEHCRAFCQESGRTVEISGYCSNSISTVNWVEEGWDIAPIGGSGGFPTHVHLERRESGKKHDPNQFVQHQTQNFILDLTANNKNTIEIKYPGTSRNTLRLRATMNGGTRVGSDRFSNVTMNLDKADILLQREGVNDYEHIVGYEGSGKTKIESKLWLGANHNTAITPTNWNNRPFGSWTQTGTYPYAHNDANNQIYDDYFFSDFYTRIDKTDFKKLTDLPTNARYNDGKYKLKPTVTNVRDELFTIPAINFSLDNFKPYISFFNVKTNGSPIYQLNRIGSEGDGKTTDDGTVSNEAQKYALKIVEDGPNTLSIEITTSEPMQNLQFAHKKETQTAFSPPAPMIPIGSNKLKWSGNISTTFSQGDCFNVQFFGQDLSTNQILGIYKNSNKNKPGDSVKIPTRKGDGPDDWNNKPTNSGVDQIDFCIKECDSKIISDNSGSRNSSDCDALTEVSSTINYISCKNAEITLAGAGFIPSNFIVTWTDGAGITLPQYNKLAIIQVTNPGTYCYKLEAINDCCEMEGCVEVIKENMENASFEVTSEISHVCTTESTNGAINLDIQGNGSPFKVDWYLKLPPIIPNPYILIQSNTNVINGSGAEDLIDKPAGTYIVHVTDKNGCSMTSTHVIEQKVHESDDIYLESEIIHPCGLNSDDGEINLTISGETGPYEVMYFRVLNSSPWMVGISKSTTNGNDGNEDLIGVPYGNYQVVILDANCGIAYKNVVLNKAMEISANKTYECGKFNEVLALPQISGGTPPFDYMWDDGKTTENAIIPSNISWNQSYCLTVTDQQGCTSKKCWSKDINNLESPSAKIEKGPSELLCSEGPMFLTAKLKNIYEPEYIWNTGKTTSEIEVMEPGLYKLTVTGVGGCTYRAEIQVVLSDLSPTVQIMRNPQSCACDGHLIIHDGLNDGGHNVGSVVLENLETNQKYDANISYIEVRNLCKGTYKYSITKYGCPTQEGIINLESILCNQRISLINLQHNCICNDESCTGQINIELVNPPSIYGNYKWYKDGVYFSDEKDIKNLCNGEYRVEYHYDSNKPPLEANWSIYNECNSHYSQNIRLKEIKNAKDCHSSDGILDIGLDYLGTMTYIWTNGATTSRITELNPGDYTVTVTSDCFTATSKFTICTCNDCLIDNGPGTIQFTALSNCQLYHPYGYGGPPVREVPATSKTSKDGALILPNNDYKSIRFKWTYPNGYTSDDISIYGLPIGKYELEIDYGCDLPIKQNYYVTSKEVCDNFDFDLLIEECITDKPQKAKIKVENIKGGSSQYILQYTIQCNICSPDQITLWGNYEINGNYSFDVSQYGNFIVKIWDKETGCSKTKNIYVAKPSKQAFNVKTHGAYTFRGCEKYWGDNTSGYVRLIISGGTPPFRVEWQDGLVQNYFFDGSKTGDEVWTNQRQFNAHRNELIEWSATITDACGNEKVLSDKMACNSGVDEDGNPIPCDLSEVTIRKKSDYGGGDPSGCFDKCDKAILEFYCSRIFAETNTSSKKYDVTWPDGKKVTLDKENDKEAWEAPQPGIYPIVVSNEDGCSEIFFVDYSKDCKQTSIFDYLGEGNPDSGCPRLTKQPKVLGQQGADFLIEVTLENIGAGGTDGKIKIIERGVSNGILAEVSQELFNGSNILAIPLSTFGEVPDAEEFLAMISFPNKPNCQKSLDFSFDKTGVSSCPQMQVFYDNGEGTVEIFSTKEISNCKLKIGSLPQITVNLVKNQTFEHAFDLTFTGELSITLETPASAGCVKLNQKLMNNEVCSSNTFTAPKYRFENTLKLNAYSQTNLIADMKFKKLSGGNVTIPNSSNISINGLTTFEMDISKLNPGKYKVELDYRLDCPSKFVEFEKVRVCPYSIVNHDYKPLEKKAYIWYRKTAGIEVKGQYSITPLGKPSDIKVKGNFVLPSNQTEGVYIIDAEHNLEMGSYVIYWSPYVEYNCIYENLPFNISGFKDDDPPSSNMTCKDKLFDIDVDPISGDYVLLWQPDNNSSLVIGESFDSKLTNPELNIYSAIVGNFQGVLGVELDSQKNHYITTIDIDGDISISKYSTASSKLWSILIQDKKFISQSKFSNGDIGILVFDLLSLDYKQIKISQGGGHIIEALKIPLTSYYKLQLHENGVISARYEGTGIKLKFYNKDGSVKEVELDKKINIKDVKSLDQNEFLLGGDFKGNVEINGQKFSSEGFNNIYVLKLNSNLEFSRIQVENNYRDEYLSNVAYGPDGTIAVSGNFISKPSINIPDSCLFVKVITLEDPCTTFTSTLVHNEHNCQLTWDTPPSGYTTTLQYQINGVWVDVSVVFGMDVVSSPFTVAKDGSFRLISKKQGCPDVLSNVITTACLNSCVCQVPSMVYDQTACTLSWSITECTGYSVSLQRLSSANVWETIVQQATSPYYITTYGSYRLSLSKGSQAVGGTCATVVSASVTTACTPLSNPCVCTSPTLIHNEGTCTLSWAISGCSGFTSVLQRNVAGTWMTTNASSPYNIPANSNGQYRILSSKPGCTDVLSNVINVTSSCSSPASITIFDYGTSGLGQNATILKGQSYTHEVSQGAPDACDESFIQLAFASSVVNSSWTFYVNGSVAVMPGTVIGSQFIVDLYLPTPPSGGTADVFMQSPCGDYYQLHLVYDCEISAPCNTINILCNGNVNNSCENLTITANGGTAPYSYQISGTGSQYTNINQSGSSNVINLSGLLIGEAITLSVTVTDQNGCAGDESITYLRCATGCSGNTCSSQPVVCNAILNSNSGYNEDAIINFIVPTGVNQVLIEVDPRENPQSLLVLKNGIATDINVGNIFKTTASTLFPCQQDGINIMDFTNGEEMYSGGFKNGDYASHPLTVTAGDLLMIDINHPSCTNASYWFFRIVCSGVGSRPNINIFEFENQAQLEEIGLDGLSSIAKEERKSFRFFPNPFSKGINLELTSDVAETLLLDVFNNLGLQVFKKSLDLQIGINLRYIEEFENVPAGVYTVKVKSLTKDYTTRVIKVD